MFVRPACKAPSRAAAHGAQALVSSLPIIRPDATGVGGEASRAPGPQANTIKPAPPRVRRPGAASARPNNSRWSLPAASSGSLSLPRNDARGEMEQTARMTACRPAATHEASSRARDRSTTAEPATPRTLRAPPLAAKDPNPAGLSAIAESKNGNGHAVPRSGNAPAVWRPHARRTTQKTVRSESTLRFLLPGP